MSPSERKITRCYMSPRPHPAVRFGVNRTDYGYTLHMWFGEEQEPFATVKISDGEAAKLAKALVGEYEHYESNR